MDVAEAAAEPTHPGIFLRDAILPNVVERKVEIARRLGLSRPTFYALLNGEQRVTPETALKLGRLFRNSPRFWLNMQTAWDLRRAVEALGDQLDRIEPLSDSSKLKEAAVYPASLQYLAGEVIVRFPDFPEVLTGAATEAEALSAAGDALEEAVLGRLARGEHVPSPPSAIPAEHVGVSLDRAAAARAFST